MASVPPSTWAIAPSRINSPTSTRLFPPPPKRFRSLRLPPLASSSSGDGGGSPVPEEEEPEAPDPVKLAFAKAQKYKKTKASSSLFHETNPVPESNDGVVKPLYGDLGSEFSDASANGGDDRSSQVPEAVKLAMERAKDYKTNKGVVVGTETASSDEPRNSGQEVTKARNLRDGVAENSITKKHDLKVSSIDFLGFGFSEKKSYRGLPPGLLPAVDDLSGGDSPEVKLIVGDTSKFETTTSPQMSSTEVDNNVDLYKPKVSTWGVFPRPNNISKTFGGGRVIRPGEVLETAEDKATKEQRSRELIAAYKLKMGLTMDAKTKSVCEKALREGDNFMDRGKLREALAYYEKVMQNAVFQSELHGLAALQWSICQDSLRRPDEAKMMYEKLRSHPNVGVSKKARQFVYSFQAMEMMKVKSSSLPRITGYENYFEAFVENKSSYSPPEVEQGEDALIQGLPYIILLLSPIFIILVIAVRKSYQL